MPSYPLANFEIQKYYQNELIFSNVYSRNNSAKIRHGAYVKNTDKCKWIRTHWIALYVSGETVTYFDSFEIEYIPKEIT